MNAFTKPWLPRYTPWLMITGVVLGAFSAMIQAFSRTPLFESVAVCMPRPGPGAPIPGRQAPAVAVAAEVMALGSAENLLKVMQNLNLETGWNLPPEECVRKLTGMLTIAQVPESRLIRVSARDPKSAECAAVVNGVVSARAESLRKKSANPSDPHTAAAARLQAARLSAATKRKALHEAVEAAQEALDTPGKADPPPGRHGWLEKVPKKFYSDEDLRKLSLPEEREPLRAGWMAETAKLEEARSAYEAMAGTNVFEIVGVQRGIPAMNPIDAGIRDLFSKGIFAGAGTGLLLSVLLGRILKAPLVKSPAPAPDRDLPGSDLH